MVLSTGPFGGIRVAAAAVQGAIVGATAGFLVISWFYRESDPDTFAVDTAVDVAVATALGFTVAEAVVHMGRTPPRRRQMSDDRGAWHEGDRRTTGQDPISPICNTSSRSTAGSPHGRDSSERAIRRTTSRVLSRAPSTCSDSGSGWARSPIQICSPRSARTGRSSSRTGSRRFTRWGGGHGPSGAWATRRLSSTSRHGRST